MGTDQKRNDHSSPSGYPCAPVRGLTEGLHSLTGSYNVGIAVYTFLQMLILVGVLAGLYTLKNGSIGLFPLQLYKKWASVPVARTKNISIMVYSFKYFIENIPVNSI